MLTKLSISKRWISRDPLGERGGINLYDYVGNNPIIRIDPLGLWQVSITVPVFTGLGAKVTFGNNGGSGWFNGQWNAGGYIGAEMGEGAIDVNLHDSGELGTRGQATIRDSLVHTHKFRSSVLYWIASLTSSASIRSLPARSATVRATLRIRS